MEGKNGGGLGMRLVKTVASFPGHTQEPGNEAGADGCFFNAFANTASALLIDYYTNVKSLFLLL